MAQETKNSILIIGGGLLGLSIAYEFSRNNFNVLVLSKNRNESAGFVAAGMLATHAEGLEDELLKLQKQKINLIGEQKNIKIDLFNSKLRSPIDGFILGINTRVGERPQNEGILDIGSSQKMEALIEVYESDIDRVFISQNVELSSENGGFQKNLKGKVIRISPQVKQRKVLSTDPTGDADSRIIEVLVKLDQDSIDIVQNYAGMKVIAKFIH